MPKPTPEQRLAQIDDARRRWQRRLTRATNAINKLERERRRLTHTIETGRAARSVALLQSIAAEEKPVKVEPVPPVTAPITPPSDDLSIPGFLKRTQASIDEGKRKDKEAADQIKQAADEKRRAKARGRVAKMKAKARGDLTAMPLTGKAALDAIRRGAR